MLTLLRPTQRNVLTQFVKAQLLGLPALQNRFDDIGCEECAAKNLADITLCQAGMLGQRSHGDCFSPNHLFIPAVGAGDGLDQ